MTTNKQTSTPAADIQASNGTNYGTAQPEAAKTSLGEAPENPLSEREMEVARLLVTGATNGEIARNLVISPHTVKVHLRNVFDKLQVSSRTEASMLLVKRGWVVVPGVEVGGEAADEGEAAIPQPEPLPDIEAQPRPWQLGIVLSALAVALVFLLLPAWITTPKSTLGLLSDSGQTLLGKPVLNNLPYRWEVQPPLSQPRSRLAAVEVEGQIYVIGGESEEGVSLDLVEIYHLESKQWRQGAPLPSPRANLALAISGGDLLVAGGSHLDTAAGSALTVDNGEAAATLLYDDMARYDRAADKWTVGGKLPMPLAGTALTAHGDMLYLLGGWNGRQMQDAVWRLPLDHFDNATADDWEVISHLPNSVAWFGAVMVDDLIYVLGGFDGRSELADCATYNVSTGEWRQLATLHYPRGGVTAVYDGITVLALGGGWASTIQNHERYDELTDQWTTIASPISGEWRHFGAAANNGSVYILGGWSGAYLDMHVQFQSTFRALLPAIPNIREEK
jgi:DNA-binding CsgD family transcriptional regulator/N-acetylneuraminic acid mutarotase